MLHIQPVHLSGELVVLEPLQMTHAEELLAVAQDQDIWTYMPSNPSSSLAVMQQTISDALRKQESVRELPFLIRERVSGRVLGSTRYLTIEPRDRGLEIGWTWLESSARRTGVNTECKYLLLRHAFETLGAIRVQFKTDSRNLCSQRAIERIGGIKEGVLRNHMILPDGYYRASVYFSILEDEWPQVKANLLAKMAR
jgi:RimJ/RimL family protein N-acetyltransferase